MTRLRLELTTSRSGGEHSTIRLPVARYQSYKRYIMPLGRTLISTVIELMLLWRYGYLENGVSETPHIVVREDCFLGAFYLTSALLSIFFSSQVMKSPVVCFHTEERVNIFVSSFIFIFYIIIH